MAKKVAIVNCVGFDRGGATTVCVEYAKLGIDVLFNISHPLDSTLIDLYKSMKNLYTYSSEKELVQLLVRYDRVLFFNMWYGKTIPETVLDCAILTKSTYPDKDVCYMTCFRKIDDMQRLLPICQKHQFMFDHVFSLNPQIKNVTGWCNATVMNMNAVTLSQYSPVPVGDRKKIVFSSGRTEAFKNTTKYIQSITDEFLQSSGDFTYLHEGAGFNFNKSGGVSCQPQLLSVFNLVSPKTVKPQYTFKHYGEVPDTTKFNLYPAYNFNEIEMRWKYYYAGVCCILGTVSGYSITNNLFDTKLEISDSRERKLTEEKAKNWNTDLEYADIEKITFGVPVFFSRMYADIIGFTDERLIYNAFSEIPNKVSALSSCYDEVREVQYQWLVDKVKGVNESIIKNFTKEFSNA